MNMLWEVEYANEFGEWWDSLSEDEQVSVDASVRLLEAKGPVLGFPHSSKVIRSRHGHMRELRTQHEGRPLRILYAFDPRRVAILLIGGVKKVMTGGMNRMCRSLTGFMMSTWSNFARRD